MRSPCRSALLATLATAICAATAQTPQAATPAATPAATQAAPPSTPPATTQPSSAPNPEGTLHASTQLVVVDVVVQDQSGNPIHGLKREDFALTESKQPQTIRNFDEHTRATAIAGPVMPKMPPGTFTNYTPVAPNETLNILLLDSLNTPMTDQSYVRYQLQQYVKKAVPGTRIAIFGLSSRLFLLQGFTSDPETLKEAVEHKLLPRASSLLDDPVGTGSDAYNLSDAAQDMGNTQVASNLQQFEAEAQAFQTQLRTEYTLDAFNDLGHYLSNFPGRKNLIWFSGSFPLAIFPDPTLDNPFAVMADNEEEFRETTNLLTRAQVAVYPVDARGLMVDPTFSAASSGRANIRNPGATSQKFFQSQSAEHSTMMQLAEATGGHAYYNTNDLASAVSKSIDAGANYYTLSFTPTNHNWKGEFRPLKVTLTAANAARGLKLSYRDGYYADDPNKPRKGIEAAALTVGTAADNRSAAAYARTAMSHGAPTPEDILIKARILPASTNPEDSVAPGNNLNPVKPIKGPYRRFVIDAVALPADFHLDAKPDGNHSGAIEISAFLFDNDGTLLNATGSTAQLNLPPKSYELFRKNPLNFHLEISAPVKGESYVRLGIHDLNTNHFGVIEVPLYPISKLQPAAPPTAPAATPKAVTNPATPTAPSTPPK